MHLLSWDDQHDLCLINVFTEPIPPYTILSHTWGTDHDEVTLIDLQQRQGQSKAGYDKLRFCVEQSRRDQLDYVWIDTCCIDKTNLVELSEAITSMFDWYRDAAKCYVYLTDVSAYQSDGPVGGELSWESSFRASRWFLRGWTLQELLAPAHVEFFSCEKVSLGTKLSLARLIHEITSIPIAALDGTTPLHQFSVTERLQWSEKRKTTRIEDGAYCLLGLFDVSLPPLYGEKGKAFYRLKKEILDRNSIEAITKIPSTGIRSLRSCLDSAPLMMSRDPVDRIGSTDQLLMKLDWPQLSAVLPQQQHMPESCFGDVQQLEHDVSTNRSRGKLATSKSRSEANPQTRRIPNIVSMHDFEKPHASAAHRQSKGAAVQHPKSACHKGKCPCSCHQSQYQSLMSIALLPAHLLIRCQCQQKDIRLGFSFFQKLLKIRLQADWTRGLRLSSSLRLHATVKRTSPAFLVIDKCFYGLLDFEQARRVLYELKQSNVMDFTDITSDGDGLLEKVIRAPWSPLRRDLQFRLIEFLINEGALSNNERVLELALKWIGEGPFVALLETLTSQALDIGDVTPHLFSKWPRAASGDWLDPYHSGDPFYLYAMTLLTKSDPEFGGTTELHAAVLHGNQTLVQKLSQRNDTLSTHSNFRGQNILHLAVLNPSMTIQVLDVFRDIELDARDAFGTTPLMYAVSYGVTRSVQILLEAGADTFCMDDLNGFCAWSYALICADDELLFASIDTYTSLRPDLAARVVGYCLRFRMICHNARWSDPKCIRLARLLDSSHEHNLISPTGNTLLHLCASWEATTLLCRKTIPINTSNNHGYTPLMILARHQDSALVKDSVDQGASVDLVDEHGRNVLHHLVSSLATRNLCMKDPKKGVTTMESVAILLSFKADLTQNDDCHCPCSLFGCTPASYFFPISRIESAWGGSIKLVLYLIELLVVMKYMRSAEIEIVLEALFRHQRFDELGMTHTCCRRSDRHYYSEMLPGIDYRLPFEDELSYARGETYHLHASARLDMMTEKDTDAEEIRAEERHLAQDLQDDCDRFSGTARGDVEAAWISLLSRRAMMMEEAIQSAEDKRNKMKVVVQSNRPRRVQVNGEIITSSPLRYVDPQKDRIVESYHTLPDTFRWCPLIRLQTAVEEFIDAFENHKNYSAITYGGFTDPSMWNYRRRQLTTQLLKEVQRLREIPEEQRNWDKVGDP